MVVRGSTFDKTMVVHLISKCAQCFFWKNSFFENPIYFWYIIYIFLKYNVIDFPEKNHEKMSYHGFQNDLPWFLPFFAEKLDLPWFFPTRVLKPWKFHWFKCPSNLSPGSQQSATPSRSSPPRASSGDIWSILVNLI